MHDPPGSDALVPDTPEPDTSGNDTARYDAAGRPTHLRPGLLALVFAGGVIGTAARAAVALVVPQPAGVPLPTLTVNIVGSFLLGVLLEVLARRGPDVGVLRAARLTVGTGFLGGFTTYSSLTAETGALSLAGSGGIAAAYAVGSLLLGLLAAWAGILVGSVLAPGGRR
ncbi:fluoride efflux transporter FluC [uncultured Amnibacterium sp.]|uniref:fluoride efflux transporter FluC n=1 Tax=uncultured Amnibacterium sp. TaxID=1631851 RepID=UPI0035CB1CD5